MKKGFTLIETIVSIGLVAMLVVVLSGLNLMSIKVNYQTKSRDGSFNLARGICEVFKSENGIYGRSEAVRIFKYIDDVSEIKNIGEIIINADGSFEEISLCYISDSKRFTAFIEIEEMNFGIEYEDSKFLMLRVTVYQGTRDNAPAVLVCTR